MSDLHNKKSRNADRWRRSFVSCSSKLSSTFSVFSLC